MKKLIYISIGLILMGLNPPTLDAQPDTTRWSPELALQYESISDAEISPDGEHVAYVAEEAIMDETTSKFQEHIYVAASDGSFDIQYTRGDHSNMNPKWSPDGSRIAFLSTRGDKPQVYVMRLHGGEAYAITDSETGVRDFQWGPDGKQIACLIVDEKSEAEQKREQQKQDVTIVDEEFRYVHLYTTEVKPADDTTRTVQRLTKGDFNVNSFDWSPDGNTIIFSHQPTPGFDSFMDADISKVPADSGEVTSLVERSGYEGNPRFSPDGQTIAFESMGGKEIWSFKSDVWTISADGGSSRALPHTPNRSVSIVGWYQDGESLLVNDAHHMSTHLYEISVGDDRVKQISTGEGLYREASYSHESDRLAFVFENSSQAPESYVSSRSNFDRQQISERNVDKPNPTMGKTEPVTWSAPDGTTIEGLLTYPVDYNKNDRVPLILDIHGGPNAAHNRSFKRNILIGQYYAEHGYAILRPNPRGSDGRGLDFRSAIQERWGMGDIEDQQSGVDHLVQQNVAHPDSLAIWGASYGGYMTAFMITQTDRFKVAMTVAGVLNHFSMWGTTDIPDWHMAQIGGEYWENFEAYREQSPIFHVENVTTPTLVIHGAEDQRVPVSQGQEFYRALKQEEVPAKMLIYPRMPHSYGEPKQYIDWISRTLDWFDEHLGRTDTVGATK